MLFTTNLDEMIKSYSINNTKKTEKLNLFYDFCLSFHTKKQDM